MGLGGVRDDLVDGEHRVRRREHGSFSPMPSGFAVVISTASARCAPRSVISSATSQPPVFGTPTKLRVLVTSPIFADTLKVGVISNVSCSM